MVVAAAAAAEDSCRASGNVRPAGEPCLVVVPTCRVALAAAGPGAHTSQEYLDNTIDNYSRIDKYCIG